MKQQSVAQKAASMPELLQKYGLETAPLKRGLEEYDHFRLTVPVIGTFNTGKSALLNALLETPLLPTGITAKTAVPTEIAYGDNIVIATRDGREQRLGLGELRGGADLTGVTRLRVLYRSPLLKRLKSLCLVDMPGIDSGDSAHERALDGCLRTAHACILVFSADEPVVKESVADFLMQLRLREIAVSTVMTKCDKLTPNDLERARCFLQQNIQQTLGLSTAELLCVSPREDVEPFTRLLLQLQERAGEIASKRLKAVLYEVCLPLYDYLSLRQAAEQLQETELEAGMKTALENIQRLDAMFRDETERFKQQAELCGQAITEKLKRSVNDNAAPIEAMLLEGQNPAPYIDDTLCTVMASGMAGDFEPLSRGYLKRVGALLRLYGPKLTQSGQTTVTVRLDELAENRCAAKTSPSVQAVLDSFKTTSPLLDNPMLDLQALPRAKRRQEAGNRVKRLLPELINHAQPSITTVLKKSIQNSIRLAEDAVTHQEAVWGRAFQEIREERPWWDIEEKQEEVKENTLSKDLAMVRDVLTYCESKV